MTLGYLFDRFPVPSETFVAREIEGLARLGIVPKVWALRPSGASEQDLARGVAEVRVLPSPFSARTAAAKLATMTRAPLRVMDAAFPMLRGAVRSIRTGIPDIVRANSGFYLARELRREGVTHLHAHFGFVPSTVAWLAARLAGIPWSVSVHAWDVFVNRSMMPEKLLAAKRVVTCTAFARAWLLDQYPSLPKGRLVTVHHGIDVSRFHPSDLPGGKVRFLAVGRLVAKKGFGVLLRAFAGVRATLRRGGLGLDAELTLVGDGPERPALERLAQHLGLGRSLRMTGTLPQGSVRSEMAAARMLVAPSVRAKGGDMDGLPNVILEAMAASRPVVASRLSGIPEAVEHGVTGLLTAPGDHEALTRAMLVLARDRSLAVRMGAAGRLAVEARFGMERSTAALASVFADMGAIQHPA